MFFYIQEVLCIMNGQETNTQEIVIQETKNKDKSLGKMLLKAAYLIAIVMSIYQMWANSFSLLPTLKINMLHLFFLLVLTFICYPAKKGAENKVTFLDILLILTGAFVTLYLFFNFDSLLARGMIPNNLDYLISMLAIVLVLEGARRTTGNTLPIMAIVFILYAVTGPYFPGMFKHSGFTFKRLITRMYLGEEGVLGMVITISSTYVFLFLLFGEFIKRSGLGDFFCEISKAIAGGTRGGPAKMAVIMSALMGTISGASVANAATTGAFTIGLMKKTGYSPAFAGAVEASASTGGMIMPPVMGAAAFMISAFLGIPYGLVLRAAIIPAILYYLSIFIVVDTEAIRLNLGGLPKNKLPSAKKVFIESGYLIIPIVLIAILLIIGRTPIFAAFAGMISTVVVAGFKKETRMNLTDIRDCLKDAPFRALPLGMACAVIGIVVGVTNMTALGTNLAYQIVSLSHGIVELGLIFMLIASVIISMGLPATAVYIIVSVIAAPAVIQLGITPLSAHFFVFWFGCMSGIIPPVALCSFTAAGIADADPTKTALTALRITLPSFIIPFLFCFRGEIMMQPGFFTVAFFINLIYSIIITFSISMAGFGYVLGKKISIWSRILLISASILMVKPSVLNYVGIAMLIGCGIDIYIRFKKAKKELAF